jgi:type IV secretory pathway VirD2 relaxase
VRLSGKGAAAAAAHLRYLQRDGTTRDGERGTLYGRDEDAVDAKAFQERGAGDRHQFRFIVSPEDGDQYDDLKPLTRRLMDRMEQDLATKLDWVAVDHFNTGHPHTHIVVRGKDERGRSGDCQGLYDKGLRERAIELVDLDLGPRTEREVETTLRAEVEAERLTSIDRSCSRPQMPSVRSMLPDAMPSIRRFEPVDWPSWRDWDWSSRWRHPLPYGGQPGRHAAADGRAWRYHPDDAARDDRRGC